MPKKEIRILGIDDAPFDKFNDRKTLVIGTFFRGRRFTLYNLKMECKG